MTSDEALICLSISCSILLSFVNTKMLKLLTDPQLRLINPLFSVQDPGASTAVTLHFAILTFVEEGLHENHVNTNKKSKILFATSHVGTELNMCSACGQHCMSTQKPRALFQRTIRKMSAYRDAKLDSLKDFYSSILFCFFSL